MSNDLSVNIRRGELDRYHEEARRRGARIREDLAAQRVDIPRPHVPYGPQGVPMNEADAKYLREAAQHIENGYPVGGSNLTATVLKLLRDTAAAIEASAEPGGSR